MNVVRSVGCNPVQSNLVTSVAAVLMYITATITLVEKGSKFMPLPAKKSMALLDMVKGQK